MRFPLTRYRASSNTVTIIKYVSGKERARKDGGIFWVGPRTTLAKVPKTDRPVPFAFTELTQDGQQVIVQGNIHVRFDVETITVRRDFSIDPYDDTYLSDDPDRVDEDITHALQSFVREHVQTHVLKKALSNAAALQHNVFTAIKSAPEAFTTLGVNVVNLFITGVTPANLDLKKAIEAEVREQLLAAADKAMADRRKAAAETDRALKHYESETAKQLEEKRGELIEAQGTNEMAQAKTRADALELELTPLKSIEANKMLAMGIRDIAKSGRVAQFMITPEVLGLLGRPTTTPPNGS